MDALGIVRLGLAVSGVLVLGYGFYLFHPGAGAIVWGGLMLAGGVLGELKRK